MDTEMARAMIRYQPTLEGITPDDLTGFFVGWPQPPSPETHLKILQGSTHIWLAIDEQTGQVVGFVNAVSDNILAAFIPLLEVLPNYQGRGIGTELVQRMLASTQHLYAIDLVCDEDVVSFYQRMNMRPVHGMAIRNYDRQSGE